MGWSGSSALICFCGTVNNRARNLRYTDGDGLRHRFVN